MNAIANSTRMFNHKSDCDVQMAAVIGRWTITLFVLIAISACAQSKQAQGCSVRPEIFCSAFAKMRADIPEQDLAAIKGTPEKDLNKFHLTLGMAICNEAGLWQDNEITRFFKAHGADHPDAMSYVMLIALNRQLHGQGVDMEQVTQHVIVDLRPPPPPPEPGSN